MKKITQLLLLLLIPFFGNTQQRMSYNPKEINSWSAKHDMTGQKYQEEYQKHKNKGFRLVYVDGYNVDGKVRFAAIWEKKNGPGLRAKHGLTGSQYQEEFTKNKKEGYKLVHVDGYSHNGKAYYAAIWHKNDNYPTRAKHGLSSTQYQTEAVKNHKDGYRLRHVSGFSIKGKDYYAAIWEKRQGPTQITRHGLTRDQFRSEFKKHTGNGYKIVHIDSYKASGQARYAAIWEKKKGRYVGHSSLSPANYQLRMENYYYQGYKPISISGHDNAINKGYTGVWEQVGGWKSSDTKQIDQKFRDLMKKYDITGGSFAVVKDGKLVYAKGFGYSNKEKNEIASASSKYRIASISKPITGVAIMKLVEDKKLSLDEKVFGSGAILGTKYGSKAYGNREKAITVRHLLEHYAGGNSWDNNVDPNPDGGADDDWGDPMFKSNINDKGHAETIGWLLDNRNPSEPVGTVEAYSNIGYCILGRIIEQKSGQKYSDYVKQKVLKPCGITSMDIGSGYKNKRKKGEVVYYGAGAYNVRPWRMDSHGGWIASPVQLMRFAVKVDGDPVKKDILKKSTVDTMLDPSLGGDFGKGWKITGSLMKHGGSLPGTIAYIKLRNNGTYYAYTLNGRPSDEDDRDSITGDFNKALQDGIDEIKDWPSIDLF
ncbi:MAG: serine hydrolase [Saprospiraceae bacterium]|nr:serine hydrolase [Saprospiraceae bacterium]